MRTLLALMLSCAACLGQFAAQQPFFSAPQSVSTASPTSITNLFRWWVSSDVAVGVTVSNQLFDRVASEKMWQMDTASSPTNSASGIRFNGSKWLTNEQWALPVNGYSVGEIAFPSSDGDTFFFVYVPDGTAGNNGVFASLGSHSPYAIYQVSGNLEYGGEASGGPNVITAVTSGTTNDVVFAQIQGTGGFSTNVWYLNGQKVLTTSIVGIDFFVFGDIGKNTLGSFRGYVLECGIYTNSGIWPDSQATTLHTYWTNLYKYGP